MSGIRSRSAGIRSRYDCSRSAKRSSPTRSSAVSPLSRTTALRTSVTSICEILPGELRAGVRSSLSRRPASAARASSTRLVLSAPGAESVDDRQIEIGVVGTELVDDGAGLVDEIQRAPDAPDADRLPLDDHDRECPGNHPANRRVGDPRRRQQLLPPAFEVRRSRCSRRTAHRAAPSTSPRDMRSLPCTVIRVTVSASDARTKLDRVVEREPDDTGTQRRPAPAVHHDGRHRRLRPGLTCDRRNRLSAGAATGVMTTAPRAFERLHQPLRQRADRAGTQRDHGIARPHDPQQFRHDVVERARTWTGRPDPFRIDSASRPR